MANNIDIDKKCNEVLRDGKILVSTRTDTERFYIVLFMEKYYEIDMVNGVFESVSSSNSAPKYLEVLVNSNHNEIITN